MREARLGQLKEKPMLVVRLVMVALLAAFSISLTPVQPDTGCTAGERTPGGSCSCCM